jgi:hypothetical protein
LKILVRPGPAEGDFALNGVPEDSKWRCRRQRTISCVEDSEG